MTWYIRGDIFTGEGFERGYIGFKDGRIVEHNSGTPSGRTVAEGYIVPCFVNAHTHIGDSFIRKKNIDLPRDVVELVAPPHGLKHKMLREASEDEIIDGMIGSIDVMIKSGVSHFCDFRENGIDGIHMLKKALDGKKIFSIILSRPQKSEYDKKEIEILLENSDGIGLSSISDWEYPEIKKIAEHTRRKKKIFALHGSEAVREDIDLILDLKPSFLIHMIKATESDLIRARENNIPVVVCPRSNAFFGLKPDIKLMRQTGVDIMLGTDNAMLSPPNVLDELKYLKNMCREFSLKELLNMITYIPRKALNLDYNILGVNSLADFVVLDKKSLKPVYISYLETK
ncbi:MAG: hypothetical protein DRN08_00645 [Thermoplasmata archaeon]|nr:MAG: hypothetical protein DRN05_00620 [Thermoplasmata archaeon]RLF36796.1 MAG: hypothetical protein DRN08_00645 [Thermoplasmata archaeon]